jgi:DNA-directed RNA polymerase specialized sigma24 family protein
MRELVSRPLPELPYDWDWPEGVPENYDELVKVYGKYVAKQVQRYNKVHRNFEDLLQDIWMHLKSAQLLERFAIKAASRMPETMTTHEVCAYLGIRIEVWMKYQQQWVTRDLRKRADSQVWMPAPISCPDGMVAEGRYSMEALYTSDSICYVLEAVLQGRRAMRPTGYRIRPAVSGHGFKTYLSQAIHNHFANWCRTRSRRCQENLLPPDTVLTKQSDGAYSGHASGYDEPLTSWETSLTAAMEIDDEDLMDMARTIRRADIDVESDFGKQVIQTALALQQENWPSEERIRVLERVCQGMTLREAIERTAGVQKLRIAAYE